MRQDFHRADFDALAGLWNEFYPEKFRIDPEILRINTIGSPVFDWGASAFDLHLDTVELRGFVLIKRSSSPALYKGQSIDQAHLSAIAFKDPEVGVDLLADAKNVLRNRGINRLLFGADSRHFFPGCPCDFGLLCDFLMIEGFEQGGEAIDLERDLDTYEPISPMPDGYTARPCERADVESLRTFMEAEFPGRWTYDVFDKIAAEDTPGCVYAAFRGKEVAGFALLQDWTHRQPIAGGVWRNNLGEKWGSLGPIGVAASLRGKGLGHGLLGAALAHQKSKGVRRCIIDWTGLRDFYGKHGFQPTRTYRYSSLKLGE
jgi:predicted N-acetyltransferase YhbS